MSGHKTYHVAVIGAGVFGAWTAWHLAKRGKRVLLIEAHGPGHSRASSGGESRIIRMGYGADELYTRWSQRSLVQWKEFFAAKQQQLFLETGVLSLPIQFVDSVFRAPRDRVPQISRCIASASLTCP